MQGVDTLGAQYHAWTQDIWTRNWAAITVGYLRSYEKLCGWPSQQFRDAAYLGFIEVGRRFNVLGMPTSYDEFTTVWPVERDRVADPRNDGVRTPVGLMRANDMPAPRALQWLPLPAGRGDDQPSARGTTDDRFSRATPGPRQRARPSDRMETATTQRRVLSHRAGLDVRPRPMVEAGVANTLLRRGAQLAEGIPLSIVT